jgi:GH24 family phage-related lysozyme (muramidase)
VDINWSASCPNINGEKHHYWYVASNAYHEDGSHANYQSTAEDGPTSDTGTHGLVLTMAPSLLRETFKVVVKLTSCNGQDFVIATTSCTLCRAAFAMNEKGREYTKLKEGWRSHEYDNDQPAENKAGNCTIGWGHLIHAGLCQCKNPKVACGNAAEQPFFKNGITKAKGEKLFDADASTAEDIVHQLQGSDPLNQSQFNGLADFFFNLGDHGLYKRGKNGKYNKKLSSTIADEIRAGLMFEVGTRILHYAPPNLYGGHPNRLRERRFHEAILVQHANCDGC